MNNEMRMRKRQMLESLEYLDDDLISGVLIKIKPERELAEPVKTWRTPFKHWKQLVALAACLILLSAAFPTIVRFVSTTIDFLAGRGGGTTEEISNDFVNETTEMEYIYGKYLDPIENLEPLTYKALDMINSCQSINYVNIDTLNSGMSSGKKYYGTIDGYVVLWEIGAIDATHTVGVAGYDFYESSDFDIYLYKDNERVDIKKAYENELITDEFVKTIYKRSNEYTRYFTDRNIIDKIPITEEDLSAINLAWTNKFGEGSIYAESLEDVQLGKKETYCYGKFGNNIVFRAKDETVVSDNMLIDYIVAGISFTIYWPSKEIWVYSNGGLIPLSQAYDEGVLTYSDIEAIYYRHSYSYY